MAAILDKIRKGATSDDSTKGSSAKGAAKKAAKTSVKVKGTSSKKNAKSSFVKPTVSDDVRIRLGHILQAPVVTEKSMLLATANQYVFQVAIDATKSDVRRAVEVLYGVPVRSVRIARRKPVQRRFGRVVGSTKQMKRAIVSVSDGHRIDFFDEAA